MHNALVDESSPYLRQHASNPVQWMPWGEEALRRAREQDKPLLLSIGYSSCHWCHVMAAESFQDEEIAAIMNANFVCVKVDREERPDLDAIYMDALQAMTGQGGWPLNVFLTPEQDPFYGGTYFPPRPLHGMPSWPEILEAVAEAWRERGPEIRERAAEMRARLAGAAGLQPSSTPFRASALQEAIDELAGTFDRRCGGFGSAPKFPQPTVLELLVAEAGLASPCGCAEDAGRGRREGAGSREARSEAPGPAPDSPAAAMALGTLDAICSGGIHDLVGGGFHRYAVDAAWTVPHFEKMLYDNALLARACLRAFKLSGEQRLLEMSLDALAFAMRELRTPEGGFCSALDADSGGVEGAFYVWTLAHLREVLGEDADAAIAWTGASRQGNFQDPRNPEPGLNVLTDRSARERPEADLAQRIRERLLAARERRPRPQRDEKCLTSWNALMISALAEAGALLSVIAVPEPAAQRAQAITGESLIAAAVSCAELFTGSRMRDSDGRLMRSWSAGRGSLAGYLEDHAFLVEALLGLYEATFDPRWLTQARALADEMIARFADPDAGGFFSTASDAEPLIARRKDLEDNPIPSGCASAALGLTRLAALTGESSYSRHAEATLRLTHEIAPRHPLSFGHLLQALRLQLTPIAEVAIVGPPGPARDALVKVVRTRAQPNLVLAVGEGAQASETAVPLLAGRSPVNGRPAAYVCERFACLAPVTDPAQLRRALELRAGAERG